MGKDQQPRVNSNIAHQIFNKDQENGEWLQSSQSIPAGMPEEAG